eukprot:Em0005g682a
MAPGVVGCMLSTFSSIGCCPHRCTGIVQGYKDQTTIRITAELVKLFCTYVVTEIVHLDQGRNFESSIVQSTPDASGVKKSLTTPYHLQGDGMVERFNQLPKSIFAI